MLLEGFTEYNKADTDKYNKFRWWAGLTFSDVLDKAADMYPEKEALVDGDSRLSYSQVREKADKLAVGLMRLGIKKQERVLLQLPNWHEFVYSYFALQKIGAIVVLLIPRHAQTEINHLCHLTGATAWIVPKEYRKIDYLPIIDNVLKENPQLRHVILVRGEDNELFCSLEKLIERVHLTEENLRELADRRPDPMEVAHMGPTGGSTGIPKVAPHTHNDCLCNVEYRARAWELNNNDISLAVTPLGHDLTFNSAVCGAIFTFGKLVMLDSTRPEDICNTIQNEKVSAAAIVPALARRIVDFEGLRDYALSSLVKLYVGGAFSSPDLIRSVYQNLGCKYLNAFGGTEGMSSMTRLHYDLDTVCTTVGRPTCPYDIYKVIDEAGKELPPDMPGELVVKGPCIFTGYFNSPVENEKAFTDAGFFRTGDLATIDDSGNIRLAGRIKDIIIRGGENISPVEIESLIITHPDVVAVAVIGMPDPVLGERICAYIQPRPGAKINFDDIISFLKGKGASMLQLPERIEFIDNIPLTKVGKLDKQLLRGYLT